jgi:hypothetical protein
MTVTEIEAIDHLDFDFAPPCESVTTNGTPNCPGPRTAEWRVIRACCGSLALYCDECLQKKLRMQAIICPVCRFIHTENSSTKIYSLIERL